MQNNRQHLEREFWQQWQQYREHLYRCCIKWMGGNLPDAEDALSSAMLKAWDKVQYYAGKITNFKAWLTKLTHNLCVDIHRKRSRSANQLEDLESYASGDELGLVSPDKIPENALETDEKKRVIRRAIDNLPTRLRETFILHFYNELSHQQIAEQQEISYPNVCKRISQARQILREELKEYFMGEDGADTKLSVSPTATESVNREISQKDGEVKTSAEETVTVSVAVEEVESVGISETIEVARNVQPSDSVISTATHEEKVEVKHDGCGCIEATVCESQPTVILALAQFYKETGSCGNSCLVVQGMQEKFLLGKVVEKFLLPSRSPPLYQDPFFHQF